MPLNQDKGSVTTTTETETLDRTNAVAAALIQTIIEAGDSVRRT